MCSDVVLMCRLYSRMLTQWNNVSNRKSGASLRDKEKRLIHKGIGVFMAAHEARNSYFYDWWSNNDREKLNEIFYNQIPNNCVVMPIIRCFFWAQQGMRFPIYSHDNSKEHVKVFLIL